MSHFISYNLQLFAKDGPGGEKTEPATAKKLDDARKEGNVSKSKEIVNAVTLIFAFFFFKVYDRRHRRKPYEPLSYYV